MELENKKMVRALPTLSSKWTYRRPKQTSLKPIRNLIETNCYLAHANLSDSCLLNLHAQGNTQLYNRIFETEFCETLSAVPLVNGRRTYPKTNHLQTCCGPAFLFRWVNGCFGNKVFQKHSWEKTKETDAKNTCFF